MFAVGLELKFVSFLECSFSYKPIYKLPNRKCSLAPSLQKEKQQSQIDSSRYVHVFLLIYILHLIFFLFYIRLGVSIFGVLGFFAL